MSDIDTNLNQESLNNHMDIQPQGVDLKRKNNHSDNELELDEFNLDSTRINVSNDQ